MTTRTITKPSTPASQDSRKRNEEQDCFALIHKVCRLQAENEALKVQIVKLMADVRCARRLCKLAKYALNAATAENVKNQADLAQVQVNITTELDQLKTARIQIHTRAACLPDSVNESVENYNSYGCPIVARCHSDAFSSMSTLPSSPASSAWLKHRDTLQRVTELNELLAQHVMTSSAGHAQNTARASTAMRDTSYNCSTYSTSPATEASELWLKFKATMTERIRLKNSVEGPCLALRRLFDSDSDSLPCSRNQEDLLASFGDARLPATLLSRRTPPLHHTLAPLDICIKPWSSLRETRGFLTVRSSLASASSRKALMSVHSNMLIIHIQSSPNGAFDNKVASIPAAHLAYWNVKIR